ncbi:hypothetical protein QEZ54_02060 [Catellatospora sp. KI3]|uniref:hypothetical protein n=1 Tax=Catellatospora sp. KI3 TaxID=3041620 RepID=UPI00248318B6|nr:hypothetical protein [Catellatospora sp. KI3]MDI1459743.1 hypothetical protein [Catellatospora sp. KI3]
MTTPAAISIDRSTPSDGGAVLVAGLVAVVTHWRALAAVIVPTLLPALLLADVLAIVQAGPSATIVDGVLRPLATNEGSVVGGLVVAFGWLLGLNAAMVVLTGRLRGVTVPPRQALRRALRTLPESAVAVLLLLLLVGAVAVGAAFAAAGADELQLPLLVVLIAGGLVLVGTRLPLLPALVLRDNELPLLRHVHRLVDGRLPSTGIALSVVIALPWLADLLTDGRSQPVAPPYPAYLGWVGQVLAVVGLLLITAAQAALLTVAYLRQRAPGQAGSVEADPARIDAVLAALGATGTAPAPRRAAGWTLAALVPLPMLLGLGVAAVNPYGSPRAVSQQVSWSGAILATAWPAGRHPIVVTDWGVHWCRDDACASSDQHTSAVTWHGAEGTASAIGADGTVVAAGLRGRDVPDLVRTDGNDAVQLERCDGPERCDDGITRWHTGGEEAQPVLAVAPGPDGSVVVATARPLPVKEGDPERVELAVTRCNTVHCNRRSLAVLGTVEAALTSPDRHGDSLRTVVAQLTLTLDADDHPTLLLRDAAGGRAWLATCPAADCRGARVEQIGAPADATLPAALLDRGGPRLVEGAELGGDQGRWPVAVRGDTACGLTTAPGPEPVVSVRIGAPTPTPRRLALWCMPADGATWPPRRVTLAPLTGEPYYLALVAAPDGRLLALWDDDGYRHALLVTL